MNYTETLEYIHCGFFGGTRPGLERVTELLEKLGNPQDSLRFIHVSGTNGKGSFCSMCDSILRQAGYHTGLYTSPYIERFNERMQVDGAPISDNELAEITTYVRPFAESMDDKPTEFELITAVAMVFFKRHKCDPIVLEVGMGGRLDATNIIRNPLISVITGISLDHTAILGDTIEKIAKEKAGIIKDNAPVLYGGTSLSALEVIKSVAKEKNSDFYFVDQTKVIVNSYSLEETKFTFEGKEETIKLLGVYQPHNAANVIKAVEILRTRGLSISEKALTNGLLNAKWPARFELLSKENPLFLIDGSHNPEGIEAAISGIKQYFGNEKVILVTGVMKDKDYPQMAKDLSEIAYAAFTLKPNNPRSLDPYAYAEEFKKNGLFSVASDTIDEALKKAVNKAREDKHPIVALGSLYMYGDVKQAFFKAI